MLLSSAARHALKAPIAAHVVLVTAAALARVELQLARVEVASLIGVVLHYIHVFTVNAELFSQFFSVQFFHLVSEVVCFFAQHGNLTLEL